MITYPIGLFFCIRSIFIVLSSFQWNPILNYVQHFSDHFNTIYLNVLYVSFLLLFNFCFLFSTNFQFYFSTFRRRYPFWTTMSRAFSSYHNTCAKGLENSLLNSVRFTVNFFLFLLFLNPFSVKCCVYLTRKHFSYPKAKRQVIEYSRP